MNIKTTVTTGTDINELQARTARLDAERESLYSEARRVVLWGVQRGLLKRPAKKKREEDAGDE